MYYEHYGLKAPPFRITPDTSLFYPGGNRGAILDALVYAITTGEGITKVVGEVGSGKTMLCRMLEVRLPGSVEVVYLANPSLAPEDTLHAIAFEMKLPVGQADNRLQVMQALQEYLVRKHAENRQVVVFVEEAQSMPLGTLEEIRLLSNLETNQYKLLQIVMFGQPELEDNLSAPNIRQLRERITHSFNLDPFNRGEIGEYLNHRMQAAGYRGPDVFSLKAVKAIERRSRGLTRRVNILADKALLAAYASGEHTVTTKHVGIAAKDSDFGYRKAWVSPWWYAAAAGISVAVIGAGLWYMSSAHLSAPPAELAVSVPAPVAGAGHVSSPAMQIRAASLRSRSGPEFDHAAMAGGTESTADQVLSPSLPVSVEDQPPVAAAGAGGVAALQGDETPARPRGLQELRDAVQRSSIAAVATQNRPVAPGSGDAAGGAAVGTPIPLAPAATGDIQTLDVSMQQVADRLNVQRGEPVQSGRAAPAQQPRTATGGTPRSREYLQLRLEETSRWVRQVNGDHYSIQLMMIHPDRGPHLELNLSEAGLRAELDRVYVYETSVRGRDLLSVLLDEYSTASDAELALASLPASLHASGPFVRPIRNIRVYQGR